MKLLSRPVVCIYQLFASRSQVRRTIMTSTTLSKDHLEVTKDEARNATIHSSVVSSIKNLSPTVKELELVVKPTSEGQEFRFRPGQWVDMFIPGVEKVGGFSITCSPKEFQVSQKLTLAIKYSTWPPANWVHTQCKTGSAVELRSGGEFILPDKPVGDHVFVAGGVGVNPIISMIAHLRDINHNDRITLLFSAKTVEELIFKDRFGSISSKLPTFGAYYFVTGSSNNLAFSENIQGRRMTVEDISSHLNPDSMLYVCGPPSLIELCKTLKGQCRDILYEKWW